MPTSKPDTEDKREYWAQRCAGCGGLIGFYNKVGRCCSYMHSDGLRYHVNCSDTSIRPTTPIGVYWELWAGLWAYLKSLGGVNMQCPSTIGLEDTFRNTLGACGGRVTVPHNERDKRCRHCWGFAITAALREFRKGGK